MIRFKQTYDTCGTGLAYQMAIYVLMRSIEERTGLDWVISVNELQALRNTFTGLKLDIRNKEEEDYTVVEVDDEAGFDGILAKVTDGVELDLYPTPKNFVATGDNGDLYAQIKEEFVFRGDVEEKCRNFRDTIDGEVIAMHVRRGDFADIANGMFLCGSDYYENALRELPEDLPVLIFTNDKDGVIADNELIASNPSRFTFVTDLFNDNHFINCDVGQELDRLVDINGDCRFTYKGALAKLAKDRLDVAPTYTELTDKMAEIAKELHPTYVQKLKTHSYNYSFDMCLMSLCDYVIMANSTYSIWGAELSTANKVIYPKYWIQGHADDVQVKTDLAGEDQARERCVQLNRDHYIPVENPDPRSFTVVS